jgi:hypothetical protein
VALRTPLTVDFRRDRGIALSRRGCEGTIVALGQIDPAHFSPTGQTSVMWKAADYFDTDSGERPNADLVGMAPQ